MLADIFWKKSQHNFLIAFLMVLVLFANGPDENCQWLPTFFGKKKSAQFPNSIPNDVSPVC